MTEERKDPTLEQLERALAACLAEGVTPYDLFAYGVALDMEDLLVADGDGDGPQTCAGQVGMAREADSDDPWSFVEDIYDHAAWAAGLVDASKGRTPSA